MKFLNTKALCGIISASCDFAFTGAFFAILSALIGVILIVFDAHITFAILTITFGFILGAIIAQIPSRSEREINRRNKKSQDNFRRAFGNSVLAAASELTKRSQHQYPKEA